MAQLTWQKSSFSEGGADTCFEVAAGPGGITYVRESDDPATVVTTTPAALGAFIRAVKAGALDDLAR
jgi:hypothetical protein